MDTDEWPLRYFNFLAIPLGIFTAVLAALADLVLFLLRGSMRLGRHISSLIKVSFRPPQTQYLLRETRTTTSRLRRV